MVDKANFFLLLYPRTKRSREKEASTNTGNSWQGVGVDPEGLHIAYSGTQLEKSKWAQNHGGAFRYGVCHGTCSWFEMSARNSEVGTQGDFRKSMHLGGV